jgi:ParB-like chromosome segregation protein Spo0J
MYEELPLDAFVPHPQNTNKISKMFLKKLRYNIQQVGLYETITVRKHPTERDKFEILNGHARLDALREIGRKTVKCDIWNVDDTNACLFLAILNRLRGSDVPELRMSLLFDLLKVRTKDELAAHLPETSAYLSKLERLPEDIQEEIEKTTELSDVVVINFFLSIENHKIVTNALDRITKEFHVSDSSEALVKLAEFYLENKAWKQSC